MATIMLFVHVLCFAAALMLTTGVSIALSRVAATRDPRVIARVFSVARPLQIGGGVMWIVTGALGGWLASTMGPAPWLPYAYVAFAVLLLAGFGLHAPWSAKVGRLAAADPGETAGPELSAAIDAPLEKVAKLVSSMAILALIWLMVAKPGA
jgi:hypothetical protein